MDTASVPVRPVRLFVTIGWVVPLAALTHPFPLLMYLGGLAEKLAGSSTKISLLDMTFAYVLMGLGVGAAFWVPTLLVGWGLAAGLLHRLKQGHALPSYGHVFAMAVLAGLVGQAPIWGYYIVNDTTGQQNLIENLATMVPLITIITVPPAAFAAWLVKKIALSDKPATSDG